MQLPVPDERQDLEISGARQPSRRDDTRGEGAVVMEQETAEVHGLRLVLIQQELLALSARCAPPSAPQVREWVQWLRWIEDDLRESVVSSLSEREGVRGGPSAPPEGEPR